MPIYYSFLYSQTDIEEDAVTTAKIANGAVIASKLAVNSVTTEKILDANITMAKAENILKTITNLITDPGDGVAIPVTASGTVELESGDSEGDETRTLAAPSFTGQLLCMAMKTDGGDDITVAVANAINDTGNDEITFDDEGEFIILVGVPVGAEFEWKLLHDGGVTLSTAS